MCGKSKGIIQKICIKLMEEYSLKKNATICRRQLLPFGMIFFQVLLVLVLPGIKTTFHSPICIEMYLKVRSLQKSSGHGLQLIESEWNLAPLPLRHVYIHDLESALFRVGPRFDIKDREWKAGNKALADYEITQLRVSFRKNRLWFLKKDLEMKGTQCDECRLQSSNSKSWLENSPCAGCHGFPVFPLSKMGDSQPIFAKLLPVLDPQCGVHLNISP